MDHELNIQWCTEDSHSLPEEKLIRQWFDLGILAIVETASEVCLRIVDDEEITTLNQQYRGKTGATNVLSFPNGAVDESDRVLLGDIVISRGVVMKEAADQNKSVNSHFAHLLIHGLLHLQGYDHSEEDQALEMESIEIKLMGSLGFSDPYL